MGHKDIATTMEIYADATSDAKIKSFGNLGARSGFHNRKRIKRG
ncbi:hypothetical protein [uncultured Eubacterium sp.]|nr:hypothetical protein [uncultured Eubacterium sp.]